jgi:hypothetical protein
MYCVYIYKFIFIHMNLYILNFIDNRLNKTIMNDRPDPSSEGSPDINKTITVKEYVTSGHEPQMELDTKTE